MGEIKMKTKKGLRINFLGKSGGIEFHSEWHDKVKISGRDMKKHPELASIVIHNLYKLREGKRVDNVYEK